MELASFILSIVALLGAFLTYLYHDRKIKKQEKLLNDYQLKKIETEEIENKKAQIKGNIIIGDRGSCSFIIFNSGKSTAHNIRIEILSKLDGIINFEFVPYEMLNPQERTQTRFFLTERHVQTLKVKYIWNDDFKQDNEFIQVLSIT